MDKLKPVDEFPRGLDAKTSILGAQLHPLFKIISELSRDSRGGLFRAKSVSDGRKVAIKVLSRQCHVDKTVLKSPTIKNTLKTLDVMFSAENAFVVLEQPRGMALSRILPKHGNMPAPLAVSVVLEILSVLKSLHAEKRVHDGINPGSVFVSRSIGGAVNVELVYLELAGDSAWHNDSGYLPPELTAASGRATLQTDLWAVAVLLYEMIFGSHPFKGRTEHETLGRVLLEALTFSTGFAEDFPDLASVLRRALDKNPKIRYSSAEAMADALVDLGRVPRKVTPHAPRKRTRSDSAAFAREDGRASRVPTLPAPPHESLISESAKTDPESTKTSSRESLTPESTIAVLDLTKPCITPSLLAREERMAGFRPQSRSLFAAVIAVVVMGVVFFGLWLLFGSFPEKGNDVPELVGGAGDVRAKAADLPAPIKKEAVDITEEAAPRETPHPEASAPANDTAGPYKRRFERDLGVRKGTSGKSDRRSGKVDKEGPKDDLSSNPFQLKNNPFPVGE